MNKERILGVTVSDLNYDDLESRVASDIAEDRKSFIVAINPEKILKARRDKELFDLLEKADYPIADGIGVVLASRIKKGNIKSRVTGIETMDELCRLSRDNGYRIFLYGAKEESVTGAESALKKKFPGINITGHINGYEKDSKKITEKINAGNADIIFVALGSPCQEKWIINNMDKLSCKVFMGVGGSFDVYSGAVKRAPERLRKMGLEWLYRLIKEPKRLFRQIKLLKFIILVILSK